MNSNIFFHSCGHRNKFSNFKNFRSCIITPFCCDALSNFAYHVDPGRTERLRAIACYCVRVALFVSHLHYRSYFPTLTKSTFPSEPVSSSQYSSVSFFKLS